MLNKIKTFFLNYYWFIIIIWLSILDFFTKFTWIIELILLLVFISWVLHILNIDYNKSEYKKIKDLFNVYKYTIWFFIRTIFIIFLFYILLYFIWWFESITKQLISLSIKDIIIILLSLFLVSIWVNELLNNRKNNSTNYENWFYIWILLLFLSTYTYLYLSNTWNI